MKHCLILIVLFAFLLTGCHQIPQPTEPTLNPTESTDFTTNTTESIQVDTEATEATEATELSYASSTQTTPLDFPCWITHYDGVTSYTVYKNEDGSLHTGWLELDGKRYYLGEDGILQTGWLELDDKRYYLQEDGTMARGEVPINGRSHFFTSDGNEIIIANPWCSIFDDYTPDLVTAEGDYLVDRSCVDSLLQMLRDCRAAGFDAQITSAYRSHETQVYLYDRKVNYYLDLGYDQDTAQKTAATIIAIPGTSEHELGLAVDLVDSSYWVLDEAQENTPAQKWLMKHCWEYGFILRYPNDKSEYTGIIYEPWHYRYVGKDVAKAIYESGLCLEEYLNSLC